MDERRRQVDCRLSGWSVAGAGDGCRVGPIERHADPSRAQAGLDGGGHATRHVLWCGGRLEAHTQLADQLIPGEAMAEDQTIGQPFQAPASRLEKLNKIAGGILQQDL